MKTILVCEHETLTRKGLVAIIENSPEVKIVGDVGGSDAALEHLRHNETDILMLEWRLPGGAGLELIERARLLRPKLTVMVVTNSGDEPFASRLLESGVTVLIGKNAPPAELMQGLCAAASQRVYVSAHIAQQITYAKLTGTEQSLLSELSNRELQIMMLLVDGVSVQDTAARLCLSPKTVSTYRSRMFEKVGVRSDAELTRLAFRHGLLEQEMPMTPPLLTQIVAIPQH
jgi:two-component system invasion response regulator UvrY